MATYTTQIAKALALCTTKGQAATLRQLAQGAPGDASKPWVPGTPVATNTSIIAVVLPAAEGVTRLGYSNVTELGLTVTQARFLIIPASGLAADILPGDKVIGVEGVTAQWEVVETDLLAPNGERIIWQVLIKRLGEGEPA